MDAPGRISPALCAASGGVVAILRLRRMPSHKTDASMPSGSLSRRKSIPGGIVPNPCGPKDGWKANGPLTSAKFATKTNTIPPLSPVVCAPGSALGIAQAQAQDKTAKLKGASFKVKGKNGTYAPAIGPFRMTVVLGGLFEGAVGQCAQHTFPAPNCVTSGGGKQIKCK